MLTTESEARSLWCPHARVVLQMTSYEVLRDARPGDAANILARVAGQPCNRITITTEDDRSAVSAGDLEAFSCMASACMAWRWAPTSVQHVEEGRPPLGYCGLAGGVMP